MAVNSIYVRKLLSSVTELLWLTCHPELEKQWWDLQEMSLWNHPTFVPLSSLPRSSLTVYPLVNLSRRKELQQWFFYLSSRSYTANWLSPPHLGNIWPLEGKRFILVSEMDLGVLMEKNPVLWSYESTTENWQHSLLTWYLGYSERSNTTKIIHL